MPVSENRAAESGVWASGERSPYQHRSADVLAIIVCTSFALLEGIR